MRKLAKDGAKRMHLEETTVFTARLVSAPTCSRGSRMAALKQEMYPAVAIGKILGGNLLRVIRQVLPKSIAHP
jgi:hypothetical protein